MKNTPGFDPIRRSDNGRKNDLSKLRIDAPNRCPDLTRSIMGRLGYMRVTRRAAWRRSVRLWSARGALVLTVLLALNIAFRFHESSDQIRRPAGLTIPEAIGRDIDHQQRRVGSFIQTIRSLSPSTQPSEEPSSGDPGKPLLNEDANRSVAAMMRWV